jgi:hypothetical protein
MTAHAYFLVLCFFNGPCGVVQMDVNAQTCNKTLAAFELSEALLVKNGRERTVALAQCRDMGDGKLLAQFAPH